MSFKEMPNKSLPPVLLVDLRRRGIRVPLEIQMRILYYKEVSETRDRKEALLVEIRELELCTRWQFPVFCGQNEWKSCYERPQNPRVPIPDPPCHWCTKVYRELLPMGFRGEVRRPQPNIQRMYNECSWMAMEFYREGVVGEPLGSRLTNGINQLRQLDLEDPVSGIIHWMTVTVSIVDVMIALTRLDQ